MARHNEAVCPSSRMKLAVAKVLEDAGYLGGVKVEVRDGHPNLVMQIRYTAVGEPMIGGIRRISKPSRRVYVGQGEVPKIRNGLGIAVISTSKGILSDQAAREASVGGEVVCEVW